MPTPVIPITIRFPANMYPDMIGAARGADISTNAWVVQAVAEKLSGLAETLGTEKREAKT